MRTVQQMASSILKILMLCLAIFSCSDGIERKIKLELLSPSGSHKIILQSVDGGTATEHLNKVFVLRRDLKLRKDATPVLSTIEGNIVNISWKDDKNILLTVKSESLIRYQVVRNYGTTIFVETEEGENR